ncbi:cathepsin L-like proteinase [Solanum tuberosum]|uniref:cathepsin L-like proteinase n=1 Tax=Solanum tuberosum TaxID=4113 RepID=UPI00073A169B|nr:PREDICTED: cathepsin L-like proteinase [Solanum tuberosum]
MYDRQRSDYNSPRLLHVEITWVGKKVLLHTYRQGRCGSCRACAGVGAITVVDAIKRKRAVIPLSKQQVIDCVLEKYPNPELEKMLKENECPLANAFMVYQFAMDYGIVEEYKYPYTMEKRVFASVVVIELGLKVARAENSELIADKYFKKFLAFYENL